MTTAVLLDNWWRWLMCSLALSPSYIFRLQVLHALRRDLSHMPLHFRDQNREIGNLFLVLFEAVKLLLVCQNGLVQAEWWKSNVVRLMYWFEKKITPFDEFWGDLHWMLWESKHDVKWTWVTSMTFTLLGESWPCVTCKLPRWFDCVNVDAGRNTHETLLPISFLLLSITRWPRSRTY